jgi:hypothetical protein
MGIRYKLPEGGRLRLLGGSGSIRVIAEDRDDVEVDQPNSHAEVKGEVLEVRSKSGSLTARCPTGTRVSVGAISGSVRLEGTFASVKVSAISGSVHVGSVRGDADVRSVSGSLSIESCGGDCSLNTKSGRITVGHVEKGLQAATISGTIEVGTAGQGRGAEVDLGQRLSPDPGGALPPREVPHALRPRALRLPAGRGLRTQSHHTLRIDRDYEGMTPVRAATAVQTVEGAIAFTDIVGFTEFTALRGDEAALELLATQDRVIQDTIDGRGAWSGAWGTA